MPRPQISGTVILRVELHCNANGSNKDYIVTVAGYQDGYRVFSEYGPHGRIRSGGEQTTAAVSLYEANRIADRLIAEKKRKKYQIVRSTSAAPNVAAAKPRLAKSATRRDQLSASSLAVIARMF
jgi:predicted DNA-binding WGR domain protein